MACGTWEPLSPGISVLTSPQHTFNTDTILLASFLRQNAMSFVPTLGQAVEPFRCGGLAEAAQNTFGP